MYVWFIRTNSLLLIYSKFPKWFSLELIEMVETKKRLHMQYKTTNSISDYELFSAVRKECQRLSKKLKYEYFRNIEEQLPGSSINLYKLAKSLKGDKSDYPKIMYHNNECAKSVNDMVELFASYFRSIYDEASTGDRVTVVPATDRICIPPIVFTLHDVDQGIKSLDASKSAGPDGIPPMFVKNCSAILSGVLQKIFNVSISSGVFPTLWKTGHLIPIFKKGDRSDISNYRPICIQSCVPKMFEAILLAKIKNDIAVIISNKQHGFMQHRSTLTNLLSFQADIMDALVLRSQTDCVYTDYSKAFDRVPHDILLSKLCSYGVSGSLLRWLTSYLSDRDLSVKIFGTVSSTFFARSGVPQGSHLGPILFNIFINDLLDEFDGVRFVLFADDLKIYRSIGSFDDCMVLQRNIDALVAWCKTNEIKLNIEKCQVMRFFKIKQPIVFPYSVDGVQLESVTQIRDLGVIMDSGLTFIPHVRAMVDKALRTLGFVLRLGSDFYHVQTFVTLFQGVVRPILEYNSVLWSPYYQVHSRNIERVQNRLLRFINYRLGVPVREINYKHLRDTYNLQPLSARREVSDMVFLYKLINGQIDAPELLQRIHLHVPNRLTRATQTFSTANTTTNYHYNSPLQRLPREANRLVDVDVFAPSLNVFKKELYMFIME
jgi:hypothetical protein